MLKLKDLIYISEKNISESLISKQIEILKKEKCFLNISRPAKINDGIKLIEDINKYIGIFNNKIAKYSICKFIPASGAASRMFYRLVDFFNNKENYDIYNGGFYSVNNTLNNIEKFAFFEKLKNNCNINDKYELIENILYKNLNYVNTPKGLIDFHKYSTNEVRNAFEEQIHETLALTKNSCNIHLTISQEFAELFNNNLFEIKAKLKIENINVSFSFQDSSSDTVAIYEDASIVRNEEGSILFRPGGHGSLLKNLNNLKHDIVFIKNIDNISHASFFNETIDYKKLLAGYLIDIKEKINFYYKILNNRIGDNDVFEIQCFLNETFGIKTNFDNNASVEERAKILIELLNRPIRVCGMVKNAGEPGGGPFWVKDDDNIESLQIVEKSQINLNYSEQKKCLNESTHFNPVDMVCWIKNLDGKVFDLQDFIDKDAYFTSDKVYKSKKIKVIEHPGLWNGSMAKWLTVFIEVPTISFNPVKEINDLLREMHFQKKI